MVKFPDWLSSVPFWFRYLNAQAVSTSFLGSRFVETQMQALRNQECRNWTLGFVRGIRAGYQLQLNHNVVCRGQELSHPSDLTARFELLGKRPVRRAFRFQEDFPINTLPIRCIAILGAVVVAPCVLAQSRDLIPELPAPHLDLRLPSSRPSLYHDKPGATRKSRFHLDREIKLMDVFQGAAETIDGYSTWQFTHARLYYAEGDRFSRFFIGEKATPWKMGVFGAAEALGAAYLSQYM